MTWNPNPTGKGGFRDHPDHAFQPTSAHMASLGRDGGRKSGATRGKQADARFLVRARRALLDVRADLSLEDVAALTRILRRSYDEGMTRGYARGISRKRGPDASEAA